MKVLMFNRTYSAGLRIPNSCRFCTFNKSEDCAKMSTAFCIEYGGFQPSDTKIFTL